MAESNLDIGRLHFFEPSTIAFENKDGTNSDSITFPYDKYNIAVDLRVFINDRYSCGLSDITGEVKGYEFSTTGGTLSFLGGTNGFLTTNYTDIQNLNPSQNTQECLGIESINITYDSWLHPTVVIKFVDIRGATVMQPAEQNYYNEGDQSDSYKLYKSLFTFPYPLFILKVKGFYGKGVTYRLAVNKVDIDFDAKSGNFNITVNFIGHIYGLFADVPISYLAVAPYTEEGNKYWNERVNGSKKEFWFHLTDSYGNEVPHTPMLKLPELAKKVAEVECAQNIINAESETQRLMQDLDTDIELLNNIILCYNDLFDNKNIPFFSYYEEDKSNPTFSYVFIAGSGNSGNTIDGRVDVREKFKALSEALDVYDEKFSSGTKLKNYFGALDSWTSDKNYNTFLKTSKGWKGGSGTYRGFLHLHEDDKWESVVSQAFLNDGNNEKYSEDLHRFLLDCIGSTGTTDGSIPISPISYENMSRFNLYVRDRRIKTTYKQAIELVQNRKSKAEEKKKEKLSEFKKENESNIEKALGFRPSIKNMFDLMFAHLETFMHVYYEYLKRIKQQLTEKSDKRKKTTYSIENGFTDTERGGSGYGLRGDFLPPFAAFYETWKDEGNDGDRSRKKEMWPGKLPGNPEENLEEIKFVHELLNGSKLFFEEMKEAERVIAEYRASGTTIDLESTAPSTSTSDFIPITVFDIANNGRYSNPYNSIASKIRSNVNPDEIIGDVYALFSLRMFYYLVSSQGRDNPEAGVFGRIEAINFYKAVGVIHSRSFVNFIRKFADDRNLSDEKEDFISKLTKDSKDTITSSWQISNPNAKPNLFNYATNDSLSYCYSKPDSDNENFVYLPLHIDSVNQLKDDFSNYSELKANKRYISSTNHGYFYGNDEEKLQLKYTLNGGTFLMFENRDYVTTLFQNIENELVREKEETDDENVKSLLDVSDYEIKRGSKTYNRISDNINGECNRTIIGDAFCYISGENSGKELSDGEISTILKYGTDEDTANIFVKWSELKGQVEQKFYSQTGAPRNKSIFDDDLYRLQTNVEAKAYLFLQRIPLVFTNLGLTDDVNTVAQKASLLKEGAYYWWMENRETKFVISGHVEAFVAALDKDKKPIPKPEHDVSYVLPDKDKTFYGEYYYYKPHLSGVTYSTSYGSIPISYVEMSDNVTESRKIYLKKYFEKWANDDFSKNLERLEDLTLRVPMNNNGSTYYSYGSPLDMKLVNMSSGESDNVEEAKQLQVFLKDLFLKVCTIFDYYGGFYGQDMAVKVLDFKNGFRNFMDQLHNIYWEIAEADDDTIGKAFTDSNIGNPVEDPFKSNDLRLSTYMSLKSLYDKWICGSLKGENTWKVNTKPRLSEKHSLFTARNSSEKNTDSGLYELDNFIYMDSLYRDISHRLKVNLTKVSDWLSKTIPSVNMNISENLMNYNSKTLYEFLTELAQDCGGYIIAIPQRFMFNNSNDIKTMFTPIPSCEHWDDNSYTYMFLYNYRPSEHLGDITTSNMDMNGWSPDGDGYSLTDSEIIGELYSNDIGSYGVPAFGVTFGKGNQSYFKDIKLSTGQFGVTEAGLNATFQIASKASETIRQTTLYGQDIYKVYSNNAYECTVEMMGDMQIFPPMLFQLNNIPMWKGAYMIKKVTHVITPGDATTTFVGVRQNKYLIPFSDSDIVSFVDTETTNELSVTYDESGNPVYNVMGTSQNDYSSLNYAHEYNGEQPVKTFTDRSLLETEKTNIGLVSYCKAQLGRPYWYGSQGQIASPELEQRLRRQSFTSGQWSQSKYNNANTQYGLKVHDCIGLIKGYFWSDGLDEPTTKNRIDLYPDVNASGAYTHGTLKSNDMSKMPDVPGLAVFKKDGGKIVHVGVYIGDGKTIEAEGHKNGVVEKTFNSSYWNGGWCYIDELYYYNG